MNRWQTVLNFAAEVLRRRGIAQSVLDQRGGRAVSRLTTRLLCLGMTLLVFSGSSFCWAVGGTEPGGPETSIPSSPPAQEGEPAVDRTSADETPEQAQRRELTAQHGAEVADAILSGNVLQEMTMEQVQLARGSPARKEVIPPDAELWHYPAGEVAFSAGTVSYVSLESKTEAISDESSAETKHAQSEAGSNFEQGQPAVFSSDALAEKTIVNSPGDGFLALRSEPSTRRGVRLRKIPHATPLVLDECVSTSSTARWCRTTFQGKTGWVLDRYLSKTNDGRNHALGGRVHSPPKGDPMRSAIMDAIRTEYSRPVLFLVHDLKVSGDWAWVEVTGTINGRQEYEPNEYVLHKEHEKWKVMDSVNASDPSVVYQRYEELRARFPEAPIP